MKIGLMSDTHGHLDIMRQVAAKMVDKHNVDEIIHLGDDSTDVENLSMLSVGLSFVPGIFEERYKDPTIPNRIIKEFEDVPFLLTHTPTRDSHDLEDDIDPTEAIEDGDVKVMLHGHSHRYRIDEDKGVIIVNPGHLKPADERGEDPTYAILEVTSKKIDVKILSMNDDILAEKTFFLET